MKKGEELASLQSTADRSVTASGMSNGVKEAGDPQSGNPFSSSALSPLASSIQTIAPSLQLFPSPKNNRIPYSPALQQSKLSQHCTSLYFLEGPNIC